MIWSDELMLKLMVMLMLMLVMMLMLMLMIILMIRRGADDHMIRWADADVDADAKQMNRWAYDPMSWCWCWCWCFDKVKLYYLKHITHKQYNRRHLRSSRVLQNFTKDSEDCIRIEQKHSMLSGLFSTFFPIKHWNLCRSCVNLRNLLYFRWIRIITGPLGL